MAAEVRQAAELESSAVRATQMGQGQGDLSTVGGQPGEHLDDVAAAREAWRALPGEAHILRQGAET